MIKEYQVRYGQTYKVVLAIILPCLLIIPFIFVMQLFKSLEEWKLWTIILTFLGAIIGLSIWLVFRIYPKALLCINKHEISIIFNHEYHLAPADFSFKIEEISSFKVGFIGNGDQYVFETQNPIRNFQVSAVSFKVDDLIDFNEVMVQIDGMVNNKE